MHASIAPVNLVCLHSAFDIFQAKLLEEMDAEFGVGDLVAEDIRTERRNVYATKDLKGLRVEHDLVSLLCA